MEFASNEAQLSLALQTLKRDTTLSIPVATKVYGVPKTMLLRRRNNQLSRRDTMPICRKSTDIEESTIIQYVLDLDARSYPPRLRDVEDMTNRLLVDRGALPVGPRWASNFVKRHKEISTRFTRRYAYQRALCDDPNVICGWFQPVRDTIAEYDIQDADIYSLDETGFAMGMISTTMVVTSSERRGRPSLSQPGNRERVSVVQGVNSQGWIIPPFIVIAGKHHLTNWYEDSTLPSDWVIATTHNGWTTNEKGVEWIQNFEKHTKPRSCGANRLLTMDGHESHHSTLFCKEHRNITLCMPAHSSNILQPLDAGCFGPLKKAYGREIEGLMKARSSHITKTEFLPAFFAAHHAAMTEKISRGHLDEQVLFHLMQKVF
ncbi:transposase [Metarhizium guizhouense ARSEF 977]|uniref:Transposase n=1 Tax=Metarhizium guizhouense (strain ARSEF 977) TaxID=1276136 RepID=A0A0B4G864_METGA|nr:transposase [Metarhizium guizhouense ARSEF 977]